MNRSLPLSFAVALALASSTVNALGLGAISVKSDLNEPLRAEIPVLVNNADEAMNLRASLAAAEEFARVGLNIGGLAVPIRFEVIRNARGEPMIAVTSDQPVREPFLSFLVEVNWANGRLLREYSVLLDPPVSAPAIAGSLAAVEKIAEPEMLPVEPLSDEPVISDQNPEAGNVPQSIAEPEQPSEPLQSELEAVEATKPPEPESNFRTQAPESEPISEPVQEPELAIDESTFTSDYGPVVTGETLWEIATTTRPDDNISLNQMMLALWRANPAAFYQDNVNALKRGAILRIPGKEEIKVTEVAQAAVEILQQNRRWIEATRPTLVADSSASSLGEDSASNTVSNVNSSRLELVPPAADGNSSDRPGMAAGTGDSAVRAEVVRTKEALASSQSEVSELRSRVKELEDVSQKSERLLELKNSELKALQDRLAEAEKQAQEATLQLGAERAQVVVDPVQESGIDTAAMLEDEPSTANSESLASATQPAENVAGSVPADLPAVAENATIQETATVSATLDTETENVEVIPLPESEAAQSAPTTIISPETTAPWYKNSLFLGGGALLLAGLSVLGLYSRRRKSSTNFTPQRNSIADEFAGGIGGVKTGNQKSISTEAKLLNAVASNPTNIIAHLDVVDYFYNKQDVQKFEAAAEAMYAQVSDVSSPEWQSVVLMGEMIAPTHPLFSGQNESEMLSSQLGEEFDAKSFNSSISPSASEDTSRFSGEFDMVSIDVFEPSASVWRDEQNPVFTNEAETAMNFTDSYSTNNDTDDLQFDFDLDLDATRSADDTVMQSTPVAKLPVTDVFQQVKVVTADSLGDDAVATKIDLARAYLDMGDPDGARSMLEEVMTEGNPSQRAEAASLLAEMR